MSMSTHVVGFKPPDETWKRMKAAWDACKAAGIEPPAEVATFFNWEAPDDHGVELSEKQLTDMGAVRPWRTEYSQGIEVILEKLPSDVKIVRFYNSW